MQADQNIKENKRFITEQLKIYLKGKRITCSNCGIQAGIRTKIAGTDIIKGVSLKKIDNRYLCQLCR